MKEFKLESHVADVRMRVRGGNLEELFEVGLEGLAELIRPGTCKGEMAVVEQFECTAGDTTTLLIDFLGEVLTLSQVNRAIFCTVDFSELTETWLRATIRGTVVDAFDEDVKAVTYHEAAITRDDEGNYESIIVLDI